MHMMELMEAQFETSQGTVWTLSINVITVNVNLRCEGKKSIHLYEVLWCL